MTTITHTDSHPLTRATTWLRDEVNVARLAIGVVALHVVDDNFLQPNPGTTAGDHLVSGLVPLALLAAAAVFYGRLRAGARAAIALLAGYFGVLGGIEALHYTREVGPSGDDYTGLLSLLAGLVLLGVGGLTLWRSRRRDDRLWWRYGRRALFGAGAVVVAGAFLFPFSVGYVVTHASRATVPAADLGAPFEEVAFTTNDGLRLKGWYIRSRNGAAVISFPGRASSQKRAKLLARHGYGVLVFDRRGEGESEGDPNLFGWEGERDVHAAVEFLRNRPEVDPDRIGGIGLSVGGEMMIEAAAESEALRAIVSEGASARSVRDIVANPGTTWSEVLGNGVATLSTSIFSNDLPPADLKSLVPKISGAVLFVYGENGQPAEEPANRAFYAVAHEPKELWEVPGSGHIGGTEARPREYERRVVAFFDRYLLGT
jgi:MYXO-CTERM domain-containing protein